MPTLPMDSSELSYPARSRTRNILIPIVILLVALTIAVAFIRTRPQAKPVEVTEKAWLVSAQAVAPRPWSPSLTLYGRVESLWSSELTAGVTADVNAVEVIEGDTVDQGELLLSLDERDARLLLAQREAELREAEAQIASEESRHQANLQALPREKELLALTQAEAGRLQDLVTKKIAAQSNLDTARQAVERQGISLSDREQAVREHEPRMAELQARRARLEALRDQAQLELERCRVTAPFDARVARVLVSPGKRVRVGDALLVLYDTAALVVRAQVPSRYLPAVRAARADGKELMVEGSIDRQAVTARLLRLAGEVASGTGGVEGLFEIEGAGDFLQQGRFVRMDLKLPEQPGLIALPHEAIYGTDRVYTIDGESRMRPVRVERVGETRNGGGGSLVLIRADVLEADDRIITTQLPNALDGLLVRVAEN